MHITLNIEHSSRCLPTPDLEYDVLILDFQGQPHLTSAPLAQAIHREHGPYHWCYISPETVNCAISKFQEQITRWQEIKNENI